MTVAPPRRAVTAGVLLHTYTQLHILELLCQGVERHEASRAAWRLYYDRIPLLTYAESAEAYQVNLVNRRYRFSCLAASADRNAATLREGYHLGDDDTPARGGPVRAALLPEDLRAALVWHRGKPRQRRRPVETTWLAAQVNDTLNQLWSAIQQAADDGNMAKPSWMDGRRPLGQPQHERR
jgi:hypothetical protein